MKVKPIFYIVFLCLVIRIIILSLYPEIYGLDSVARLSYKESILVAHWLPVAQSIVYFSYKIFQDVFTIRIVFSIIGCLSLIPFYFLLKEKFNENESLFITLLLGINPLYIFLTMVPYQEGPFFLAVFSFFYFWSKEKYIPSSICFIIASLTRYEILIIFPIIVIAQFLKKRNQNIKNLCWLLSLLLGFFIWNLWNLNQNSDFFSVYTSYNGHQDTYNLGSRAIAVGQIIFWSFLYGTPLLLLGFVGFISTLKMKLKWPLVLKVLFFSFLYLTILLPFLIENGFVNQRFSIYLVIILICFIPKGLGAFKNWVPVTLSKTIIIIAFIISSFYYINRETSEYDTNVPYRIAQYFNSIDNNNIKCIIFSAINPEFKEFESAMQLKVAGQVNKPKFIFESAHLLKDSTIFEIKDQIDKTTDFYFLIFDDEQNTFLKFKNDNDNLFGRYPIELVSKWDGINLFRLNK